MSTPLSDMYSKARLEEETVETLVETVTDRGHLRKVTLSSGETIDVVDPKFITYLEHRINDMEKRYNDLSTRHGRVEDQNRRLRADMKKLEARLRG
jgi:hypothetical protein